MKTNRSAVFALLLLCALLLGACSVAPHGKTVVLQRPKPTPTPTTHATGTSAISFELDKVTMLPLNNLDQLGFLGIKNAKLVYGWLDSEHLIAVGVRPISSSSPTSASSSPSPAPSVVKTPVPQPPEVARKLADVSGLTGEILSVDWQTGQTSELHTVQDSVITALGLSHDRSKLWYTTMGTKGANSLSVTDISFRHDLLETDYDGSPPVWSTHDKLLVSFAYPGPSARLSVFDGVQNRSYPLKLVLNYQQSVIAAQDESGDILAQEIDGRMLLLHLNQNDDGSSGSFPLSIEKMFFTSDDVVIKQIEKAQLAGTDYLLCQSIGKSGRSFNVVDISTNAILQGYGDVVNFALSDDQKYICLVRQTAGSSADVFVAEFSDGRITNEKLVYKGFVADLNIFFSPDDRKLYLEGRYSYMDENSTAMVLQFK